MIERKMTKHRGSGGELVMVGAVNVAGIRNWTLAEVDFPDLPGAVCKGDPDPDAWFPEAGRPGERQAAAIAKCEACPIRQKCLDFALEYDAKYEGSDTLEGIWGGKTKAERKKMPKPVVLRRCRKNRHDMTPENTRNGGQCYACRLETNARYKREREAS